MLQVAASAAGLDARLGQPIAPELRRVSDAGAKTNATNESPPASEATADADRRIAALERERDALAAEVGRLERHRDSTSPGLGNAPGVAATGYARRTVRS